MKKVLLTIFALIAIGTVFSGCEKTDYQHPMHRG
jgi:predicted small secreted protein